MEFNEVIEFIYGLADYERCKRMYRFDLSSYRDFLANFGSPQEELNTPILVTGTKGKGSTVHFLESILSRRGSTGVFTSPHLVNIRERIKFNGVPISEKDFVEKFTTIKSCITKKRTTFEVLTSISFLYFREQSPDYSLYEVGVGGRLDSTNVLSPELSIITPISLDHTDVLGNTLEAISREKCGILRKNGLCISAPQDPSVMAVIKEECKNRFCKLKIVGEDIFCEDVSCDSNGSYFKIDKERYFVPLIGRHQVINALISILAARAIGISNTDIKKGISETKCAGRLQIIGEEPYIIIDGAHNRASMAVLTRAIKELFTYKHLFLIFAALSNKDIDGMVDIVSEITDRVFITKVESERAKDPNEIIPLFKKRGIPAEVIESPEMCLSMAEKQAGKSDLILITGSFYLVGEVLTLYYERSAE